MESLSILTEGTSPYLSLTRALLLFYVIIACNFTGDLFSKQLRTFIQNNRPAQHVIGFILMLVIIILFGGVTNTYHAILYAIIGYMWFILTTKLDIQWSIIIILLMLGGFLYEATINEKERKALLDPNLTEEQKEQIIEAGTQRKTYILLAILSVTIIGALLYANKKVEQYGGGAFDVITYFFY